MSNGETTLKNEDSINVRSYILFFSFRRFLSSRSLSLGSLLPSRSRIFHTRILTRLRFLFCLIFFFSLLISPFLSLTHTHAHTYIHAHFLLLYLLPYTIDAKCFYTQSVPTCVCICVCTFSRLFSFNQSSRSYFARRFPHFFPSFLLEIRSRILFFHFKFLHVLTHSLTLVNRFGSGGIWKGVGGGRAG